MIFRPPAATNGHPNGDALNRYPDRVGLIADARLLGTAVILAAAALSGGATTAIT